MKKIKLSFKRIIMISVVSMIMCLLFVFVVIFPGGKKFCSYRDMGGLCSGENCIKQGKWVNIGTDCLSFAVD